MANIFTQPSPQKVSYGPHQYTTALQQYTTARTNILKCLSRMVLIYIKQHFSLAQFLQKLNNSEADLDKLL